MEANNLSDREFRVIIIRILNNVKKDTETVKKDQSEIKNAISEINGTLEGINSKLDEAEDWISDPHKDTQAEQQKEKKNFNKWGQLKNPLGQHEA